MELIKRHTTLFMFILLIILVILLDISNLDNLLYSVLCGLVSSSGFITHCAKYYDVQILDFIVAIGTISAGYFAYLAVTESNLRLNIEQSPYVVFSDRILTNSHGQLHIISVKNIGRGSAMCVVATSDPMGKISIIDGSNPHSIDLSQGQVHNNWAINEAMVRAGLRIQGFKLDLPITQGGIPDENVLEPAEKYKSDFNIYLWYRDQLHNKYLTIGKFRNSGGFLKVMENIVKKLK